MRCGKNFCCRSNICGEHSTKFKRFRFVVEKAISNKKKKNDDGLIRKELIEQKKHKRERERERERESKFSQERE